MFRLTAVLVVLLCMGQVSAEPIIDVGIHQLLPDTPDQTIEISVSGGQPVAGLEFFSQVADGGPEAEGVPGGPQTGEGIDGPETTDVDLFTGTIFEHNNLPAARQSLLPQLFHASTVTAAGTVAAEGLLATVTIDTSGFFSGEWGLYLGDTLDPESTHFLSASAQTVSPQITEGLIRIGFIPEPSTLVLLSIAVGLFAFAWRWRRRKSTMNSPATAQRSDHTRRSIWQSP